MSASATAAIVNMSQMARPVMANNMRRVLLGATESHSVPAPITIKKKMIDLGKPALQWAAGSTESAAIPSAVPRPRF